MVVSIGQSLKSSKILKVTQINLLTSGLQSGIIKTSKTVTHYPTLEEIFAGHVQPEFMADSVKENMKLMAEAGMFEE